MSALTQVAGYPVHAVARYQHWTSQYGVKFTSWWAACGANGNASGHQPFGRAGSARRKELCPSCFPGGHSADHPEPVEVTL